MDPYLERRKQLSGGTSFWIDVMLGVGGVIVGCALSWFSPVQWTQHPLFMILVAAISAIAGFRLVWAYNFVFVVPKQMHEADQKEIADLRLELKKLERRLQDSALWDAMAVKFMGVDSDVLAEWRSEDSKPTIWGFIGPEAPREHFRSLASEAGIMLRETSVPSGELTDGIDPSWTWVEFLKRNQYGANGDDITGFKRDKSGVFEPRYSGEIAEAAHKSAIMCNNISTKIKKPDAHFGPRSFWFPWRDAPEPPPK